MIEKDKGYGRGFRAASIVALLLMFGCSRESSTETEKVEDPFVEDWPEAADTIHIKPDSVWEATHEDSVRFGLITE